MGHTGGTFSKSKRPQRSRKGTPNRTTRINREFITRLLSEDLETAQHDLRRLKKQSIFRYWQIRLKLTGFVLPRLQAIAIGAVDARPYEGPAITDGATAAAVYEQVIAGTLDADSVRFAAPAALEHQLVTPAPVERASTEAQAPALISSRQDPPRNLVVEPPLSAPDEPAPGGVQCFADPAALERAQQERTQQKADFHARIEAQNERDRAAQRVREARERTEVTP